MQAITIGSSGAAVTALPVFVADEAGFFEEEDLDVEILDNLRGGPAIMSALTSGSADIVSQGVAASALNFTAGMKAPLVAAQSVGVPYQLVVASDSTVPTATDGKDGWQQTVLALDRAPIAASGGGSVFDILLKGLFRDVGLSEDAFSNINVGLGGPSLAALQTGQVEAVIADPGTAQLLESSGVGRTALTMWKQGPDWLQDQAFSGYIATDQFVQEKPEAVKRFRAAIKKAQNYIKDSSNLDSIKSIAVDRLGITESPELDQTLTTFAGQMYEGFTAEQVETTLEFMKKSGQLPPDSPIAPADVAVESVLLD